MIRPHTDYILRRRTWSLCLNRLVLAAGVAVSLLLGGCGEPGKARSAKPAGLAILTSFYPIYLHTLNLAGGIPGVSVRNLTASTTGCLHDYQLSPQEMASIATADVLVVNGAGMESFLEKVVRQQPQLKVVDASHGLDLIREGGEANPHLWVSVTGALGQVRNIATGLAAADPAHAAQYQANAAAYADRLEALRQRLHQGLDSLPNRRIVTMHEAFPYFAREFGLEIVAVVEREPGTEPSSGELAQTVDRIRQSGVKVVFAEPQYPTKAADAIARETGATVYTLDPAVTGPADAGAYVQIMERNLAVLRQALK